MKKSFYFIPFLFFISIIVFINFYHSTIEESKDLIEADYFKNLDLYIKGEVCEVEWRKDGNMYLVSLNVLESNYDNYNKIINNSIFCMKDSRKAVFADNFISYSKGDIVYIGKNNNDIIICKNSFGKTKLKKKRTEAFLYDVISPYKRMKEILKTPALASL